FEGTIVEQRLGRAIMPWFHGCFSLGTIGGAGLGTLVSRAGVAITWHVWSAIIAVVIITAISVVFFFPDKEHVATADPSPGSSPTEPGGAQRGRAGYGRAWLEPRTLLVGLIVMAASLTEGAAND